MAGNEIASVEIAVGRPSAAKEPHDVEVYNEIRDILEQARSRSVAAVNSEMVLAYWHVGKRIHEEIGTRAEYGKRLVEYLSARLTHEFGKGFTVANLNNMRQFCRVFEKSYALRSELSWTHYRTLMRIDDAAKRSYYEKAAADEHWSSRRLEREISSLRYERLATKASDASRTDVGTGRTTGSQMPASATDLNIKDPYVLDFLGLPDAAALHEADLESAIIGHIQEFLVELGAGFAFVGRQVRVSSELSDYYVDLVFYHTRLKCFVLVDLKTGKLDPRDVGQMDFYVRLFDDVVATDGDGPTVGIVLCAQGDRAVARYSALADGRGLFASRYITELPSEEDLGRAATRFLPQG